jgi:hypothetical protein
LSPRHLITTGGSPKPNAPKRTKKLKEKPPKKRAAFLFPSPYDADLYNPFLALPKLLRQRELTISPWIPVNATAK